MGLRFERELLKWVIAADADNFAMKNFPLASGDQYICPQNRCSMNKIILEQSIYTVSFIPCCVLWKNK